MRILFAGTPEVAVIPLARIASQHAVVGVLCSPDRGKGRGRHTASPPVKSRAVQLGLPVFQPRALNGDFREEVARLEPELLVVVAYHKIFREAFLSLFPGGGINLHPSLLPRYRGPSPIQAAILNGDSEIGVTVQKLALEMDAGDILAQERIPLRGTETTETLTQPVSELGAAMLLSVIDAMERGAAEAAPQDEKDASYCKLIRKRDGLVDWSWSAEKIQRMVRAFVPWPKAYTTYRGSGLILLQAHAVGSIPAPVPSGHPGTVLGKEHKYGILVETGNGLLGITALQIQSKKPMDWRSFLNGHRDFIGTHLGGGE